LSLVQKLFCAYLVVMWIAVLVIQVVFALFVDDWSFGLKDPRIAAFLAYAGVAMVVAQHAYRAFTIVLLIRKSPLAAANAQIYLVSSFVVVAVFVLSSIVYFPRNGAGIALQNLGQGAIVLAVALVLTLPWLIALRRNTRLTPD
jgi:hypothetical protein